MKVRSIAVTFHTRKEAAQVRQTNEAEGDSAVLELSRALVQMAERFRRHSIFNIGLIRDQRPGALAVGTRAEWAALGRWVAPDAIPIIILWPFGPVAHLYEVEDTLPRHNTGDIVEEFAVSGSFNVATLAALERNLLDQKRYSISVVKRRIGAGQAGTAASQITLGPEGVPIRSIEHLDGGEQIPAANPTWRVTISDRMSPAEQFVTLCHELGHIFCGHLGGCPSPTDRKDAAGWQERRDLTYFEREFEAETVAWIVARRASLVTGSEAYIQQQAPFVNPSRIDHQVILNAANRIERIAKIRYGLDGNSRTPFRQGSIR